VHCRQKCAFCRAPGNGNEKGPVVQLDKSARTATCSVCGYHGDRDKHAGVNIEAIVWSLILTGERPASLCAPYIGVYALRPRRRRDFSTF
jgi:transposase